MKLTKIVCTLGPATQTTAIIASLIDAGMNVARLNFSHGTYPQHTALIANIRTASRRKKCPVGILQDIRGAQIRTGDIREPLKIHAKQAVIFSPRSLANSLHPVIEVSYDDFAKDVAETDRILIDSGELSFSILRIHPDGTVLARANEDGVISSRRHINLPGADLDLPALTQKDWQDIAFGIEAGIDYFALSFIRSAQDVLSVRNFLNERDSQIRIIAKIETKRAVEDLSAIVQAADGVMVARGDLGADVPLEDVPALQDEIVARCHDYGKPVIVATNMLESMTQHPVPTRAELTDIAHAVTTGADATMLSAETASGCYPVRSVETMARVIESTERRLSRLSTDGHDHAQRSENDAIADAVHSLAHSTKAGGIVVLDSTGVTAQSISITRPRVPIVSFAQDAGVLHWMTVQYGIIPVNAPVRSLPAALRWCAGANVLLSDRTTVIVVERNISGATFSIHQCAR